jgi:hypothetical protein
MSLCSDISLLKFNKATLPTLSKITISEANKIFEMQSCWEIKRKETRKTATR